MEGVLTLQTETKLSRAELREKIMQLETVMLAMKDRAIQIETTHHFAQGIYMRQVRIPKGATVTGKIHKTEHLNILSQGKLQVLTEDGVKVLTASTVTLSQPGIKRAGYAIEESVWITVHANPDDSRDVDLIEERLIARTFAEVPGMEPKKIEGGT